MSSATGRQTGDDDTGEREYGPAIDRATARARVYAAAQLLVFEVGMGMRPRYSNLNAAYRNVISAVELLRGIETTWADQRPTSTGGNIEIELSKLRDQVVELERQQARNAEILVKDLVSIEQLREHLSEMGEDVSSIDHRLFELELETAGETAMDQVYRRLEALEHQKARPSKHETADSGMNGWLPIDTAPRDGTTRILGMNRRGRCSVLYYYLGDEGVSGWIIPFSDGEPSLHFNGDDAGIGSAVVYWMPIPTKPSALDRSLRETTP